MHNYHPRTSRELLTDLGVGRFNATLLIEPLMLTPAITDAATVSVLVAQIQKNLHVMGAREVQPTGLIDEATRYNLAKIAGDNFLARRWFDIVTDVVGARRSGRKLTSTVVVPPRDVGLFDLPDVPGGVVTYAAAGYVLYRLLKKRRS